MIREYAIDPQVLLKCREPMIAEIMRLSFGVGTHRIPCIVPNRAFWLNEVMNTIKKLVKAGELPQKGRSTQIALELANHIVGPSSIYIERTIGVEEHLTTLNHIEKEHKNVPFYAVLHSMSPQKGKETFGEASIDSDFVSSKRWQIQTQLVRKTKTEVLETLSFLIDGACRFEFVDRNFYPGPDPNRDKWSSIILEIVRRTYTSRPAVRSKLQFVVHTTKDKQDKSKEPLDPQKVKASWASYVPTGCTIELKLHEPDELDYQLSNTGLKWHDRYLYTDLGCIYFGPGWDEDDTHEGVMGVLPKKDAERVRSQYCCEKPSFRYVREIGIHIDGTAPI